MIDGLEVVSPPPPVVPPEGAGLILEPTLVTFVEPDCMRTDYVAVLGRWEMSVPPRIGELVVMQPSLSCDWNRYRVAEVIHHIPPRGGTDGCCPNAVTVVLARNHPADEIERTVGYLARKFTQGIPLLPDEAA